jgi:hypothetical protein
MAEPDPLRPMREMDRPHSKRFGERFRPVAELAITCHFPAEILRATVPSPMATNTGQSSRKGAVKERVQAQNPVTHRYVKIDTNTGRIIDHKKTPGPYKGIKDVTRKK